MARLTRRDLKQDELRSTVEEFEQFAKQHYKEIVAVVGISILVCGLAFGLKVYTDRQEAEANAQLGAAFKTFHAYVGGAAPDTFNPEAQSQRFSTAQEKYKKALEQFNEIVRRFPRQKAAAIARYHAGVCHAELGDPGAAIRTLEEASRARDRNIASLAQFTLAGELVKTEKLADAVKLYQQLEEHPTLTVPRATAMLALADAYRRTQPAQARQIYEQMEKEFGSDTYLAATLKQQISSLPK